MKILIVQDYLRSGGTERQSILLANAFAVAGPATTLLTFRPGGALESTVGMGVTHHVLQPLDLHLDWFAPGLFRFVAARQPDIVLLMGRMANCYGAGLQQQHTRAVVIGTMRTGKPLPKLYQRSLRFDRHIVANSRDAKATLVNQYGLAAEKISVIHNSLVFPAAVAARNETLRQKHGATPATKVLLNVGMFRPEKNQRELIEVVAGLPASPAADWQLWFAGDGPARAACEQLAAAKGPEVKSRIKFLGFQPDPSAVYAAADIAVHASTSEGLSNFLIEAQAQGLPAVAYEAQGNSECFVPDRTGWTIPPGNREKFRAALAPLFRDSPAMQAERAAVARAYARETFDPVRQAAAYLDLFAWLVK